MRFFDPAHRMEKALVEHRLTVDVSDISPIGIGKPRKWSRFRVASSLARPTARKEFIG